MYDVMSALIHYKKEKAKSRKYRGMFEEHNLENNDKFGKRIGLNKKTFASPKWDGNRCPEE